MVSIRTIPPPGTQSHDLLCAQSGITQISIVATVINKIMPGGILLSLAKKLMKKAHNLRKIC